MLPCFLSATTGTQEHLPLATPPYAATYEHSNELGKAPSSCLWWPARSLLVETKAVLLFVPGNPGLCEFYRPFLSHIYDTGPNSLAILAHSLLGHSPYVTAVSWSQASLQSQVEAVIEAIDSLNAAFHSELKVILVGHSVGAWIVSQVLKERYNKISGVYFLFPTLAHIALTPNGKQLSWLFRPPLPLVISCLSRFARFLPAKVFSLLFSEWPSDQIQVLRRFISSPDSVFSALSLAHEEMQTIRQLDSSLLQDTKQKLFFLFAEEDRWVGSNKDVILHEIGGDAASIVIHTAQHGVPHAYCINHGKEVGNVCIQWLEECL